MGATAATTDAQRALLSDTKELAIAASEFMQLLCDSILSRSVCSGISQGPDHAWHEVQHRLAEVRDTNVDVRRIVGQIGQIDSHIDKVWDV